MWNRKNLNPVLQHNAIYAIAVYSMPSSRVHSVRLFVCSSVRLSVCLSPLLTTVCGGLSALRETERQTDRRTDTKRRRTTLNTQYHQHVIRSRHSSAHTYTK